MWGSISDGVRGVSEDHRGTPEAPGRVVTLIARRFWESLEDEVVKLFSFVRERRRCSNAVPLLQYHPSPSRVWGAAYHIPPAYVADVRAYLDIREVNGYSIQCTSFHPANPSQAAIHCLVYIGLPNNPQFLGVQEPGQLARHIWRSRGPSGQNSEYLFMLEEALEGLGKESGDKHVEDLARRVRALAAKELKGKASVGGSDCDEKIAETAIESEATRVINGELSHEQEVTGKENTIKSS